MLCGSTSTQRCAAVQTARFNPEEFEDRRLASSSFKRTLREPTFSLDDVTGKIYQKLTAHHQDQGLLVRCTLFLCVSCVSCVVRVLTDKPNATEEKKVLSRQASCASLPLSTESASTFMPPTFESSGVRISALGLRSYSLSSVPGWRAARSYTSFLVSR